MKTHLLLVAAPLLLATLPMTTRAQAPAALAPLRNALGVARATAVQATFAQPPAGGSLSVFSAQAGGKKAGTAATAGNTLSFTPTAAFKPGETVMATLTAATGPGHVWQFTTAAGRGTGSFSAGSNTSVSSTLMVTGDVDGDDDLDVLVATGSSYSFDLLTNNGNGSFTQRAVSTGSNALYKAILGDIDGDGDLDILATRDWSGATGVYALVNNGSGGFAAPVFVVGTGSLAGIKDLALGDLDGDGDLDLLCSRGQTPNQADILYNNGTGTFASPATLATPSQVRRFTLADLDNDGDLDLLMAHSGNAVSVRLNNGQGTSFTAAADIPESSYTATTSLGDVDGDGDLDLLIPVFQPNGYIGVWRNNGSGGFTRGTSAMTGLDNPTETTLGDVDGDGDLDLVSTGSGSSNLYVSLNQGNGTFGAATGINAGQLYSQSVALADMNNDGALDLVLGTYGNRPTGGRIDQLSVLLNSPLAPTSTATSAATTCQVWPNPAGTGTDLQLQLPDHTPTTYQLQTLLGQTVRTQTFSGGRATIVHAGLAAGVYLLRVQMAGHLPVTRRVVLD